MKKMTLALIVALAVIGILAPLTFADNCGVTKTDVIKSIIGYMNQKSDITKNQVTLLIKAYSGLISCSDALLDAAKQKATTIDTSIIPRCSDGTMYSHCSTTMPKYCYVGRIINRCDLCCETGRCMSESTCYTETNSNGIPPSISIISPANNQIFTTSAVTVTGNASDNIALKNVTLKVNTGSWQPVTGTALWTTGVNLAQGKNTITARAYDIAGNSKDASVAVTYNAPASAANVIKNPGFESGKTSWTFYTNTTGTFTTSSPGYEGINSSKITIGAASTNIQLYQYNVALEPNTKYRLSFSAYSSTGNDIVVQLIKHVTPYTAYGLDHTTNLNKTWTIYTKEFYTTGFTVNVTDARFRFWLAPFAAAGDIYYIDDIRLEKAPLSAPQAPLNLKATAGDTKVNLSWQAPSSNGGSAITNYRIYRSISTGTETYLTEVGNTLTYLDTGLNNTQKYYYKITAKNQKGEGPLSTEANATPGIATNPYLVAYWKFDNDATDSSGNGHTGTVNGPVWTAGKAGNALKFDGTNDYASFGSIASGASGTMMAWIKPGSYAEGQAIMTGCSATGADTSTRYGIYGKKTTECADGSWYTVIANGVSYQYACSGQLYNSANFPLGVWTHLAVTYDGTNVKFYKNGVLVKTLAQTVSGAGNAQPYSVGRLGGYSVWYFNGTIDEAKIYNKALSASEILADYMTAPQSPLNLKATAGDTKVNLSWQAPSSNGGSAITNYRIYRSISTGTETYLTEIGNTLTYLDTGLNNTQKYYYKITAKNQKGEGPLSTEANATPGIATNPYLVAYWKFDNNALDSTGNGHTATINGPTWTTGYNGSALKFDGINDYASAQSIPFNTYTGLTVEAWIKTDSITGTKTIFDYGVDTVHLYLSAGKPTLFIRNASSIIKTAQSATTLNKGSWYHVAGVYNKNRVYIYVNGTLKTSVSHSGSVRDDNTYGNRIGSSLVWPAMVWGNFFNGTIDDVKIYNKALNATEIYADYASH